MPAVEVVTWKASSEFLNDPASAMKSVAEYLRNSKGSIAGHTGKQIEDPEKGALIVVWDSVQSHKDVQALPTYEQFLEDFLKAALDPNAKDSLKIIHVEVPESQWELFQTAIGYNTTEFATVTPNADQDKSVLQPGLDNMISGTKAQGACWGPIAEEEGNKAMVFFGWHSLESHKQYAADHPELVEVVKPFLQVASIQMTHADFVQLF